MIYSENPIPETAEAFFLNISKSEIFKNNYSYNIFLTADKNNYCAVALYHYYSFGITKPISGNIIIAPSDINKNEVRRNGKTNKITELSHVIIHECTHRYLFEKYGLFKMKITKTWKEEGYCEYIAQGSSFGFSKGLNLFTQEKEDKSHSFDYFKYRLYVQYLIDYKKLTFNEILDKSFDLDELEDEIRTNIKDGLYIPPKK
ncbi:MAG: hypothetical protein K8R54_01025 [Bacteroidales bacterium]|nr:hypothetical protein [Bacteroidales bacterium]